MRHTARADRATIVIAAGLCALVLAAYSNTFSAGFVLDSRQLVLNDPRVHAATAENLHLILERSYWWPYGESGLYRPLTTLSYLFNYAVLGSADRPAGYHWFNLAVHAINVLLVWSLAARVSGRSAAAIAAAAIWAVHPLSTEAVTNIVGRADLLAAFGVLAGVSCYLSARQASGRRRVRWLMGLALATSAGVFAKESAVAIVGAIALVEIVWWDKRRSVRALTGAAVVAGVPIAIMLVQRHLVLSATLMAEFPFIDNPIGGADFWPARFTALHVMNGYLLKLVWPATLSVDYSYNQIPIVDGGWQSVTGLLMLVAWILAARRLRQSENGAFFFLALAAITCLPASNLLFATGTIMAERLMYLPSAGLIVVATVLLFDLAFSRRAGRLAMIAAAVCVIAGATRTWIRNDDWQNDVTLWSAAVAASPASSKAHRALAEALNATDSERANLDRVIAESELSVSLIATLPDDRSSFQSYRQAAAAHLDRAGLARRTLAPGAAIPGEVQRSYERATVLLTKAIDIARAASVQIGTTGGVQQADAHRLLAAAALGLGDAPRAIDEALSARQLNPLDPLTHRMLADVYLASGHDESAAISLMVGSMVTGQLSFRDALVDLFRGSFPGTCALMSTATGVTIDPSCPAIRAQLCSASAESIAISIQIGRVPQADLLRKAAADRLQCSPMP